MRDPKTLRFLAAHYTDLQGIRLAPLWLFGIAAFWWHPHGGQQVLLSLALIIVVTLSWARVAGWVFSSWLGSNKPQFPRPRAKGRKPLALSIGPLLPIMVAAAVMLVASHYPHHNLSADFMGPLMIFNLALLLGNAVRDDSNLVFRRIYGGLGGLALILITAFPIFNFPYSWTIGFASVDMLLMSALDLALLLWLTRRPSAASAEEAEAHG